MSLHWVMSTVFSAVYRVRFSRLDCQELFIRYYDFHKSVAVLTMALLTWRILTLLQVWWKKYANAGKEVAKMVQNVAHREFVRFMWLVQFAGFFLSIFPK